VVVRDVALGEIAQPLLQDRECIEVTLTFRFELTQRIDHRACGLERRNIIEAPATDNPGGRGCEIRAVVAWIRIGRRVPVQHPLPHVAAEVRLPKDAVAGRLAADGNEVRQPLMPSPKHCLVAST